MNRPRIRSRAKMLSPYLLLSTAISAQSMSDQNYRQQVAYFLVSEPDIGFEEKLTKLMGTRRFRELLNANATKIEEFGIKTFAAIGMSESRMWQFYRYLFRANAERISKFVSIRDRVEKCILLGDLKSASVILDESVAICGESFWYIRAKMLILATEEKTEEFERFCEQVKERAGTSSLRYLVHLCQIITGSDNAALQLKSVVLHNVLEFKETGHDSLASQLELIFVPYPLQADYDYVACLERLQTFPTVDIYNFTLTILRLASVDYKVNGRVTINDLDVILSELDSIVEDPVLSQLCKTHVGRPAAYLSPAGRRLLENYEMGRYEEVIQEFSTQKNELENPLAFVNLVAKSAAYLNKMPYSGEDRDLLESMIARLTSIYEIDPLWRQAEEAITSTAVKYHFLARSPHLQLILFKALPYRYDHRKPEFAASLSIASDLEVTPLTDSMRDAAFSRTRPVENDGRLSIPHYRKMKRELSEIDPAQIVYADVEAKFDAFRVKTPLIKDYIELVSWYCMAAGEAQTLINLASPLLSEDGNRYICVPLENLVTVIENERLCDLGSVIIAYNYNRQISQNKDYILNEAFEEYLSSLGARMPSEILENMPLLTLEQVIFFRDICVPDVMDFLSCFRNTNELRAERIKILDLLLERDALSSDVRMQEVEEIVGRVIIDAGASEFNGSKIYVDDRSIQKKYANEIASLLVYYRQAQDSSDDRFTIIGDEYNAAGLVEGYLSGNKNTTVLKMFNILSEAFKFDEKYGLDKNLSAEIRHGFFSNLMRARLEERKLITETDDVGNYKPNLYWREINAIVREDVWDLIEEDLQRFTKSFNKLILEAEEWMKIQNNSEEEARLFVFVLKKTEFDSIKNMVETSKDADKIAAFILQQMWHKTQLSLTKIRDALNGSFRQKIDALFEKLESDVRVTKRGLALIDLMAGIAHARNEIKEDITTAAEWFNRTENTEIQAGSLDQVLEIAISSFEKVKGGAFAIQKSDPFELPAIEINREAVKPFIIAIINLLDNCYRHSGLGRATRVEISGAVIGNGAKIIIRNDLSDEKCLTLSPEFISAIEAKILNADAGNLIRSEGGSGLVKAHNAISPFGSNSTVTVSRDHSQFCAEITYEP